MPRPGWSSRSRSLSSRREWCGRVFPLSVSLSLSSLSPALTLCVQHSGPPSLVEAAAAAAAGAGKETASTHAHRPRLPVWLGCAQWLAACALPPPLCRRRSQKAHDTLHRVSGPPQGDVRPPLPLLSSNPSAGLTAASPPAGPRCRRRLLRERCRLCFLLPLLLPSWPCWRWHPDPAGAPWPVRWLHARMWSVASWRRCRGRARRHQKKTELVERGAGTLCGPSLALACTASQAPTHIFRPAAALLASSPPSSSPSSVPRLSPSSTAASILLRSLPS